MTEQGKLRLKKLGMLALGLGAIGTALYKAKQGVDAVVDKSKEAYNDAAQYVEDNKGTLGAAAGATALGAAGLGAHKVQQNALQYKYGKDAFHNAVQTQVDGQFVGQNVKSTASNLLHGNLNGASSAASDVVSSGGTYLKSLGKTVGSSALGAAQNLGKSFTSRIPCRIRFR